MGVRRRNERISATATAASIITFVANLIAIILYVIGFALATYHHKADIKRTLQRKR